MANRKPINSCTIANVLLCEEEKKIIRKFQREYEDKHNELINQVDAICEIIILYDQLKDKK